MSDWFKCYAKNGWLGGVLTGASFAHPAKVSFLLAERIYQHAKEEGWLTEGQTVVDCFAGIGGFAFHALQHGLNFVGCELEPRFVAMAEQNIALWNRKYSRLPRWGSARIVQGDSRKLCDVIGETVGATISSPPYAESLHLNESEEKQHARLLKNGNAVAVQKMSGPSGSGNMGYGSTPGQLGAMRPGDVASGVISSPPYESCPVNSDIQRKAHDITTRLPDAAKDAFYGTSEGQLSGSDTFWSASRTILEQVHAILRPGGHAIWVVKAFVKGGKIVDFPGQWQALCESVGFRTLHVHRAWLVEDHGVQGALVGEDKRHRTERKSFFRRLAEKKGSPRIDFEVVLCTEKI